MTAIAHFLEQTGGVSMGLAALFIFLAAIVRGFSGFGFSLLAITSLSLLFAPARIIPAIFLLEVAASIRLFPTIWRDVHWRSVALLSAGTLIGTPAGVYLLANLPAPPMQLALAVFVMTAVVLLWWGFALKSMPGPLATVSIGAAAGLGNGAFGIGGPPVILFYFASPAGAAAGRASLTAYFVIIDLIGLAFLARENLVTAESGIFAAVFALPLLTGVWLGARSFKSADPVKFRKIVLILLGVLAVLIAWRAAAELWFS